MAVAAKPIATPANCGHDRASFGPQLLLALDEPLGDLQLPPGRQDLVLRQNRRPQPDPRCIHPRVAH
eukprot:11179465-Lingulodinium_polyedra.AAC.1